MLSVQPGTAGSVHEAGRIDVALPPGAPGQWCSIRLRLPDQAHQPTWWARLELIDAARMQIVRACFLGMMRRRGDACERRTMVHVPLQAQTLTLYVHGAATDNARAEVFRMGRLMAAAKLLWHGRGLIRPAFAGNAQGRVGRLRALLGQAPARKGEAPPYSHWISTQEAALPQPPVHFFSCQVLIFGADPAAFDITSNSLQYQSVYVPPPLRAAAKPETAKDGALWTILLQAGEILAPCAVAWFAYAAAANPNAAFITADCDELNGDGQRCNPLFKPTPDRLLMRTGLLTRGACAIRSHALPARLPTDAGSLRQHMGEAFVDNAAHVPRILTHIGPQAACLAATPIVRNRKEDFVPRVVALVPSALRSRHVPRCLHRIVRQTGYPALSVQVVVSDIRNAAPGVVRRVRRMAGVQLQEVPLPAFNYAAVNNEAALRLPNSPGGLLLLLNDDVAPINADWLDLMVAHMQDADVGIVGARLLYGNGMVQHEGVVMGLANLCEHAGRLRDGRDPGQHAIGVLDREVSAVTAACMLIRADLYKALGGMDTGFAIALNDVDLCLRARKAGWRVVFCASATLYHFESLSLGRHYAGARAALEAPEVLALRERWSGEIAADPFYSQLAALEPGREWQPAFPPRDTAIAAYPSNPAATG